MIWKKIFKKNKIIEKTWSWSFINCLEEKKKSSWISIQPQVVNCIIRIKHLKKKKIIIINKNKQNKQKTNEK